MPFCARKRSTRDGKDSMFTMTRARWCGWICALASVSSMAAEPETPQGSLAAYISTGDNHWLGESLPIDSPASIEASLRSAGPAGRAPRLLARPGRGHLDRDDARARGELPLRLALALDAAALPGSPSRSPGRGGRTPPWDGDLGRGHAGRLGQPGRHARASTTSPTTPNRDCAWSIPSGCRSIAPGG